MASRTVIILFLPILFLFQCKSPNDRIMEKFDSINRSLEKVDTVLKKNKYSELYYNIELNQKKDPALATRADTIYHSTEAIVGLIDRLKGDLQDTGAGAFKIKNPVAFFLVQTPSSDSLRNMMIALAALDSTLTLPEPIRFNKNWSEIYFNNTPTVGAVTILTKFENDCTKATTIALSSINRQL
jgi:hypothetical protein